MSGSGLRIPTNAESTTTSKISSTGSLARQSGSHSRTLFVNSAMRMPRPRAHGQLVQSRAFAALHPPLHHGGVHVEPVERERRAGAHGAERPAREVLAGQPQLEPGLARAALAVVGGGDACVLERVQLTV